MENIYCLCHGICRRIEPAFTAGYPVFSVTEFIDLCFFQFGDSSYMLIVIASYGIGTHHQAVEQRLTARKTIECERSELIIRFLAHASCSLCVFKRTARCVKSVYGFYRDHDISSAYTLANLSVKHRHPLGTLTRHPAC